MHWHRHPNKGQLSSNFITKGINDKICRHIFFNEFVEQRMVKIKTIYYFIK